MKFSAKTESFLEGLQPAINISTKETDVDYQESGVITLDVKSNKVIASAHGGGSQVISEISNNLFPELDYTCEEKGIVTLNTIEFIKALSSFDIKSSITFDIKPSITDDDEEKGFSFSLISTRKIVTKKTTKNIKERQSIPIQSDERKVVLADVPNEFDYEVEVNKDIFLEGMSRVNFAIGYEDSRPVYNSQAMYVSKKKLRFVAGTGARFAIVTYTGKGLSNLLKTDSSVSTIFPKHNISNLIVLLKSSNVENIIIKQSYNKSNYPDQIVVEFKGTQFVFLKIDNSITYPVVDNVLNKKDYSYQVQTPFSEWRLGFKGVEATNTIEYQQESPRHNAIVEANFESGWFNLKGKTNAEADRYVAFSDIFEANGTVVGDSPVGFAVNSHYLDDLYNKWEKFSDKDSDKLHISFMDQFSVKDGKTPPIVVRYPEKENSSLNIKTEYILFFSPGK
jgi:hypothetical protein